MLARTLASALAALLVLAACAGAAASPTAVAPAPTPASPSPTPAPRTVTFPAADGTILSGTLYGAGTSAVILSNMGDNDPAPWQAFAPLLAERGYTVLTYSFRFPARSPTFTSAMAQQSFDDLRAAITFVRAAGARRVALVGASLGGMASAKAAASEHADALVVLAAPVDLDAFDFHVEAGELRAIDAPKLLIGSKSDTTVPFADTQRMYDLAGDPKQLYTYPGSAHGVKLLAGEHAADLRDRLIAFISAHVPSE